MDGVEVDVEEGSQPERRDVEARATRDRLAFLLSIRPVELRTISKVTAEAMIAMIERRDPSDSS